MNFKLVFRLTGKTLLVEAVTMLLPLAVAVGYGDKLRPFLLAILITAALGFLLSALRSNTNFHAKEGFFATGLIWLLVAACGALPFYFSGYFESYVDCFFEAVSGFTTTGSSILKAVEPLPKSILFWRSFTHWLGGMGILVLTIALLPSLGERTLHVMRAESPGPIISKLVPKASQSSKILYAIYTGMTLVMIVCLLLTGMPLFDSVVNTMATAGTGGFAVLNLSIGGYQNPAAEIVIAVFMFLFSVNFSVYFLILSGKWKKALQSDELRFFSGIVLFSTVIIAVNIAHLYGNLFDTVRHAFFQVSSIISTTGFATVDFDKWPELSRAILVVLMFCGACAGSTGGGMKASRLLIFFRCLRREVRQILHPQSVNVVKLDGHAVEERVLRTVLVFLSAYVVCVFSATLIVSLDNYPFTTTFTAVVTTMSNVGPGLELVGPMGNFSIFSPISKVVLSLCMIIGRLEIFPILVLFSPNAWKKM